MKSIHPHTLGCGDRFGQQGRAQLAAFSLASHEGIDVCPVWNKSNREHSLIGTEPSSVRAEADQAVADAGWKQPYYVDADHIGLQTVSRFLGPCDFFTLDVADFIGKPASDQDIEDFVGRWATLCQSLEIPGLAKPLTVDADIMRAGARKFLFAAQEAGRISRHIAENRDGSYVTEVSMDETDTPQSPVELLLIFLMLADEKIPVQTIAPKFTGRFNKGVDYSGNLEAFEREFDADLSILAFAVKNLGFPETLKLSVHSGSDKFSLYPIIRRQIGRHQAGLHVKTAGTTWLEEVIGLAEAGGSGARIVQEIYSSALPHYEELVLPYRTVVDIHPEQLPSIERFDQWSGQQIAEAVRHDPENPHYRPDLRQFFHVSFKIAAKMGSRYIDALDEHATLVGRNVTANLLDRHIRPIFQA